MDDDELSDVRQALEVVNAEVVATSVSGSAVDERSPEVERITEYITAHEWAESASLLGIARDPGAMLARLTVVTPARPPWGAWYSPRQEKIP